MQVRLALFAVTLCLCLGQIASAQDAVKVDPAHYTVVSENAQVRILKVHYGPHEKSVMHSHPNLVAVFLTDGTNQFTYPDGKKETKSFKAGDAIYESAMTHLPENTTDSGIDIILVELKGKAPKAMAMDMK